MRASCFDNACALHVLCWRTTVTANRLVYSLRSALQDGSDASSSSDSGRGVLRARSKQQLTPYELCLLPCAALQQQQTQTLQRINAVLSAAVAARPLEQQWWKWLKSAVDAAAATASAATAAATTASTAATVTSDTDARSQQQQQQSSESELDANRNIASMHTASAADDATVVHSSKSGSELLCTELRKREHLAPVLRARLLQAAAGWGGLHALAAVDIDDASSSNSNSSTQVSVQLYFTATDDCGGFHNIDVRFSRSVRQL
jgi:hypothetical protein